VRCSSPTAATPCIKPSARYPRQQTVGLDINDRGLSRRHIIRQVETSPRRLETDYIDLYYAHDPDPDTPLQQTLAVYDDLVRQGKIRYVGLSNHPAWQVTHALWIADDRRLQATQRRELRDVRHPSTSGRDSNPRHRQHQSAER
jgi:aryl-alcohol dehydrogenase-like predicted oxidoreductase